MLKDLISRTQGVFSGLFTHIPHYIVDGANWSLDSDGKYITNGIKELFRVECRILKGTEGLSYLRRQVIHFGSQHIFTSGAYKLVHPSNRIAVTFFHGEASDPAFSTAVSVFMRELWRINKVIVSCRIMEKRIEEWGVPAEKASLIPIGVDLEIFRPVSPRQKEMMRDKLGIRQDQIAIGSFQKDGVGWGEGLEAKLIKGPDVFLDVIDRLRRHINIFVVLTGPARGFVRNGLEKMGVPYRHFLLNSYAEVAQFYHPLDLYLITSREEGGPKAVMESMATGVPLISTRVGMAPDLIEDGLNGYLCDIEDAESLTARSLDVIGDEDLRNRFRSNGIETAKGFDFINVIARRHYEEIYRPLINTL